VHYSNVGGHRGYECWIGLYKSESKASNSVTHWLDSNSSTYRNWGYGEPDSTNRCILIYDGRFRDNYCSRWIRYICKGIYFFSKVIFR